MFPTRREPQGKASPATNKQNTIVANSLTFMTAGCSSTTSPLSATDANGVSDNLGYVVTCSKAMLPPLNLVLWPRLKPSADVDAVMRQVEAELGDDTIWSISAFATAQPLDLTARLNALKLYDAVLCKPRVVLLSVVGDCTHTVDLTPHPCPVATCCHCCCCPRRRAWCWQPRASPTLAFGWPRSRRRAWCWI